MGEGEILLGALAAAMVVVTGALYALFFALGRLRASAMFSRLAWVTYAALVVCAFLLTAALGLDGPWLLVVAVMLVGYLLAPGAIWYLSVATHRGSDEAREA